MITTSHGRTYEVFLGGTPLKPRYYAHTHCTCGSTMSGGEWFPTIERAIAEAEENIKAHNLAGKHVWKVK